MKFAKIGGGFTCAVLVNELEKNGHIIDVYEYYKEKFSNKVICEKLKAITKVIIQG